MVTKNAVFMRSVAFRKRLITYLKERMRRTNVLIMESIMTVMTVATIGKKQMK